jgi:hypothetical protein
MRQALARVARGVFFVTCLLIDLATMAAVLLLVLIWKGVL